MWFVWASAVAFWFFALIVGSAFAAEAWIDYRYGRLPDGDPNMPPRAVGR